MPSLLDDVHSADLDGIDALDGFDGFGALDPDPAPPADTRAVKINRSGRKLPKAGPVASKRVNDRLSAELQAYGLMLATPIVLRDEVCGEVVVNQVPPICDALARILGRYPDLAEKFLETGVLSDVVKLFMAAWPIVTVVREHHGAGRGGDDDAGSTNDPNLYPNWSNRAR